MRAAAYLSIHEQCFVLLQMAASGPKMTQGGKSLCKVSSYRVSYVKDMSVHLYSDLVVQSHINTL